MNGGFSETIANSSAQVLLLCVAEQILHAQARLCRRVMTPFYAGCNG